MTRSCSRTAARCWQASTPSWCTVTCVSPTALGDAAVGKTLDFDQPVAVLLVAILHFLTHHDRPDQVVGRFLAQVVWENASVRLSAVRVAAITRQVGVPGVGGAQFSRGTVYSREQLTSRYGPRPARLDRPPSSVPAVAIVVLVVAVVGTVVGVVVLIAVLVFRRRRRPLPAAWSPPVQPQQWSSQPQEWPAPAAGWGTSGPRQWPPTAREPARLGTTTEPGIGAAALLNEMRDPHGRQRGHSKALASSRHCRSGRPCGSGSRTWMQTWLAPAR